MPTRPRVVRRFWTAMVLTGALAGTLAVAGCSERRSAADSATSSTSSTSASPTASPAATMTFTLTSHDFTEGGAIPQRFTCEGDDTSPQLAWHGAPEGTRSFALIVDDPDAPDPAHPKRTYVHWVLYDIPAGTTSLPAGAQGIGTDGVNDWNRAGYGGPCPPIGRHRYFFKLHALDTELPALKHPTKAQLEQAMQGHVLAKAQLMGTYEKQKK